TLSTLILLFNHNTIIKIYTTNINITTLTSTLLLYTTTFQFPNNIQILSTNTLHKLKNTHIPIFITIFSY
ncbi:MATE family efflux transporter, partial [Xanthomonas citri pv. citri]|nr:MATE family efflux transporter [Xanthomonas citri pv. citri]